ncbi:MAG: outer membrane beta-barrel protein [Candidatus Zixiibacteriota bacterium]|nr:MAG: outer membrane beta-barrel protein [candidate division Zixibacteria bacterium]
MKHRSYIVPVALLLMLAVSAGQVSSGPVKIYLGLGPTIPAAPDNLRSDYNTGLNVLTGLGYPVSPFTELIGRLELHAVSLDSNDRFGADIDFSGGGIDLLMLGADIRFSTCREGVTARPFALFGGGVSRLSQNSIFTELAFEQYASLIFESQTRLYFNLVVGLDLKVAPNLTLFAMARYLNITQDTDNIILVPVTLGLRL